MLIFILVVVLRNQSNYVAYIWETSQYSSPFNQLKILNVDYLSFFFCLPRPDLVLDQLGACLHNPPVLSGLGENNMQCYKYCTSSLKGPRFKNFNVSGKYVGQNF